MIEQFTANNFCVLQRQTTVGDSINFNEFSAIFIPRNGFKDRCVTS